MSLSNIRNQTFQRKAVFLIVGLLVVLLSTQPISASNAVSIGGTSTGPGSFPYAFAQANKDNPITFSPLASGLTCNLQGDLLPTKIIGINLAGLTSSFTIDGGATTRFPPYGITYTGTTIAGINFSGAGSLTFKQSGLSNLSSGPFFVSFSEGTFLFTGNSGILNRGSGTTVIVIAGATLTVNEAGGFGNQGSGNMIVVVPLGTLSFSQGSGFGNGGSGTYSTNISGGTISFTKNTLPPFNNFGTGNMTNNISGGSITLFGSPSFVNKSTGTMTNNMSGGKLSFSGPDTWGFVNKSTNNMINIITGGTLSFSTGATGFVNAGGGLMETMVSGGTVFMDGVNAAAGTDLNFSGTGTFSSGVNGVTFGGAYEGNNYSASLTFSASTATHQAAIGSGSLPVQMVTPVGATGTSTATLGGATLDVVSASPPSSLAGSSYTIMNTATGSGYNPSLITGTYGTLTSSSLIKYTVTYDAMKVTVIPNADQSFVGYVGRNGGVNAHRMAQYFDTMPNLAGDPVAVVLNNMILVGDVSGYQAALNIIQPSQLQVQSGLGFNNMTAVTQIGHAQMQAWTMQSALQAAQPQSFTNIEPDRVARFTQLVAKQMNAGDLSTLFNNQGDISQGKGALARLGFSNTPEQVNPHPFVGRIQVGKANIWFQPYGQIARHKGNKNGNPNFKSRLGGFALGADYEVAKNTIVGFLGGSSTTPFSWNQGRGWGHMHSGYGGLYAAWMEERGFYAEGQALFGGNRFKTARQIKFPTVNRTAKQTHNAFQFAGNLELGFAIPVCEFTLQPFIMADYMVMREAKYTENGAGNLNMHIKSRISHFLQGELGAMVYKTFAVNDILLRPIAELGWVQRRPVGSNKNEVRGGLINQPSSLVVTGLNKVYNQIAPGLGLIAQFANGFYLSGNAYGQAGDGLKIGEVLFRVGLEF